MTKPTILVTTANGRTGRVAVRELLAADHPVRALVTREDARAARLRAAGAEVVVGSLYDWRDLRRAMRGVQRAYHCPPFDARHLHSSSLVALAAEAEGLEVVALMSGWNPHATHPSVMQREHWIANNLYRRLPVEVIHVNPGMFAFPYFLGLPMVVHFGVLALPMGEGRNAPPSAEDIGAVAAHALLRPERFVGRCLRPTGPRLITPAEAAEAMGRVLGRRVRYQPVSTRMFIKAARAQGFPLFQIAQVRHYAEELRRGVYADVSDHVHEVTGRPPEPFEATAERYFARPGLVMPGLARGSLAGALGLALRMMLTRAPDLDAWEATRDYPRIAGGELAHESATWRGARERRELVLLPPKATT
ncbi:MAG: NmrA family NAD(P)-binding protein [Myxococcota bacterium]